jgi:glycine betaine/proline transport system permease protein
MTPFFEPFAIPLDVWLQQFVDWFVLHLRPVFQVIRWPVAQMLAGLQDLLLAAPAWLVLLVLFLVALRSANWRVGLFASVSFFFIGAIGLWGPAMVTLAIVATSVAFVLLIGIPLGVLASQSERFWIFLRPILDVMQSTPSFVYLVPVVMLFGVGTVPGVIATVMFALPPMIRLTNVGLRQVANDVVEAGEAFGATEIQILRDVRLPLALPVILAGLNHTIMSSLVMSTIVSMIGAEGLGASVLRGVGRLDVGLAATGGIAIVLVAMTLDRITQGLGQSRRERAALGEAVEVRAMRKIAGFAASMRRGKTSVPSPKEG